MLKDLIKRVSNHQLTKNTSWMIIAYGGRIAMQAISFVIIARVLGPAEFGLLAGLMAIVSILTPFAGWGSGNLLVMYVSREPQRFPIYWGNALLAIIVTGSLLSGVSVITGVILFPDKGILWPMGILAITQLIIFRFIEVSGQAYQSFEKLDRTAAIYLATSLFRLLAAIGFLLLDPNPTVRSWVVWYLLATLLGSGIILPITFRRLGLPALDIPLALRQWKEGFYFSLSVSSKSVYTDIDKTILLRLGTEAATGFYTAAYRVVSMAVVPVQALMAASYARFFQEGEKGIKATIGYAFRILPISVIYGLFTSIALFLISPILPIFLGADFSPSVDILRWLSIVPLFQSIHYVFADVLTGAGKQGLRSAVQLSVAILNGALSLWLIPIYSWLGAAIATLVSEFSLGVFLFIILLRYLRIERHQAAVKT